MVPEARSARLIAPRSNAFPMFFSKNSPKELPLKAGNVSFTLRKCWIGGIGGADAGKLQNLRAR
jgi:hypothetical protein